MTNEDKAKNLAINKERRHYVNALKEIITHAPGWRSRAREYLAKTQTDEENINFLDNYY